MIVILITTCTLLCGCYGNPVVETTLGTVVGESVTLENGDVIDTFFGIPYATPPVGDVRFEPTLPATPWDGVHNGTELASTCMQDAFNLWYTHPGWENYSEDCLNLNIYSKQSADGSDDLKPVMVWFHGGAFQSGASISYPGYFLASRDVVVVVVNYRLNIFGFATTEDEVVPGNMGLLDMMMSLQFLQENLQAFGGDPDKVTIFGQSAGGAGVGFLIVSPLAEGLFQQGILSSGTELSRRALHRPYTNPSNYFRDAAEEVGCPTDDSAAMVDCMKTIDETDLKNTGFNCTTGSPSCWGHEPVIDGTVIPAHPYDLHQQGRVNQVSEMIGMMSQDGFFWVPNDMADGLTREQLDEAWRELTDWFSVLWPDPSRDDIVYEAQRWFYADWPYVDDPIRNRDMYGKWLTDDYYGANPDLQAKLMSRSLPVYYYVNNMVPESSLDDWRGADHSTDNQFLFGWPFLWENPAALENSQIGTPEIAYTERDKQNSNFLMDLWTNFAKYGNPTPEPVGPDPDHRILWPMYTPGNCSYAWLDAEPHTGRDYRQQEYAYWTQYLRYLMWDEQFY